MEFLPKVAHQEKTMTTAMKRPQLHDLVKEAVAGTASKVDIDAEAMRQLANMGVVPQGREKVAAAESPTKLLPTAYIDKVAGALDYAAGLLSKQADVGTTKLGPGEGPNALQVLTPQGGENPVKEPGSQGQASGKNIPPRTPPMQSSGVAKDPSNAMATNDSMMHGEQPVEPIKNEKTSAVYRRNLAVMGLQKVAKKEAPPRSGDLPDYAYGAVPGLLGGGVPGALMGGALSSRAGEMAQQAGIDPTEGAKRSATGQIIGGLGGSLAGAGLGAGLGSIGGRGGAALGAMLGSIPGGFGGAYLGHRVATGDLRRAAEAEAAKNASVKNVYLRNMEVFGLRKMAEDAINPAHIVAGPAEAMGSAAPPGVAPSEEGVPNEPSDVNAQKALISSNQAAINYTRAQAKRDPKSDMGDVVSEPALSAARDKTLNMVFQHTQEAGAKISSDLTRTAAAQALLSKFAAEAAAKKVKQGELPGSPPDMSSAAGQSHFNAAQSSKPM